MHLVACGTQNHKITDIIVGALAVQMAHLQHVADAEAAIGANWRVLRERKLSIIDSFYRRLAHVISLRRNTKQAQLPPPK